MKIHAWSLLLIGLVLTSCTVTPDKVKPHSVGFDSTTPVGTNPQNGGLLDWIVNADGSTWGAIITSDGRDRYNTTIDMYRIQYKAEHGVDITRDTNGTTLTTWKDGKTPVYKIDAAHYKHLLMLNSWLNDKKDPDSVWMKIKDKL